MAIIAKRWGVIGLVTLLVTLLLSVFLAPDPRATADAPAVAFYSVAISRADYGINVFSYDQQLADPGTITAIQKLGMGMQQFPNANQWSWTSNTFNGYPMDQAPVSLLKWGQILQSTGNTGLFIFNYDENPLFTGGGSPQDATQLTEYIVTHHLPITAIVIGSEEYGPWDFAANLNPDKSAAYYAQQAKAIALAIHHVDPAMLVGISFDPGSSLYDRNWNQTVLRVDAPYINFVSVHDYPLTAPLSNADLLASLQSAIIAEMNSIQNQMAANVPPADTRRIQVWVTEFNPYGQPGQQSVEPVYGAAMVESALLWRVYGAQKVFFWSYDGQAHQLPLANGQWPVATSASTPFGLFALVGDGQSPELPENAFYPSAEALAQLMQGIGTGGTLSAWVGQNAVIGEVAQKNQVTTYAINLTNQPLLIQLGDESVTLSPASLQVVLNQAPYDSVGGLVPFVNGLTREPPVTYEPLPTVSLPTPSVYPGEVITLTGQHLGTATGSVEISQNGIHYGGPADAYRVTILSWSSQAVTLEIPNGSSGPALTPGSATVTVMTANGLLSSPLSMTVTSPPVLPVTGVTPQPAEPGQWVTITGHDFLPQQGAGYVKISQNGVNWGQPGDAYPVAIKRWTDQAITFLVPTNQQPVNGVWEQALADGTATLTVVNANGEVSGPVTLTIASPVPPAISSATYDPSTQTVDIQGSGLGPLPPLTAAHQAGYDQWMMEIHDNRTGTNYGYGPDWYGIVVQTWSDSQVVWQIPASYAPSAADPLVLNIYGPGDLLLESIPLTVAGTR